MHTTVTTTVAPLPSPQSISLIVSNSETERCGVSEAHLIDFIASYCSSGTTKGKQQVIRVLLVTNCTALVQ